MALLKSGDYAGGLSLMRPLAEQGHAGAQEMMGFTYHQGKGVPKTMWKR